MSMSDIWQIALREYTCLVFRCAWTKLIQSLKTLSLLYAQITQWCPSIGFLQLLYWTTDSSQNNLATSAFTKDIYFPNSQKILTFIYSKNNTHSTSIVYCGGHLYYSKYSLVHYKSNLFNILPYPSDLASSILLTSHRYQMQWLCDELLETQKWLGELSVNKYRWLILKL